jgi:hypothetical protein
VLDAQRAQNINIMLAKFGKKSYFELAQVCPRRTSAVSVNVLSRCFQRLRCAANLLCGVRDLPCGSHCRALHLVRIFIIRPVSFLCCCFLQSVRWFDAETIGAAAIASLAAFVPTSEEGSKVTAFVLKKYAQQLQQLEDQRRKEQGTRCVLVVAASQAIFRSYCEVVRGFSTLSSHNALS